MILESIENGPLIWPSIKENEVTRPKKYSELSATKEIQDDCDVKATNIILQGLPPEVYALVSNHKVAKELWERIQLLVQRTSLTKQGSVTFMMNSISLLIRRGNITDLHTMNVDQLHAYLGQYEFHANEVRLMHERNSDLIALVVTHQMTHPQLEYAPSVNQQPNFSQPDTGLIVPVFQKGLLSATTAKEKAACPNNALNQRGKGMSHDPWIAKAQTTQIVITHNVAYQADDLDAYEFDCDEIKTAKVSLMANLSHYGSDDLTKKAQQLEPKLYDGNVIQKTNAIVIRDSEETLMLTEESRFKMLLKQKDPMMSEKKVNITSVDYGNSVNSPESTPSTRPTQVEVSIELPKVSMVNTSLKKLKHHLASFDVVIKERTTATTITEGM
uniref:Integrase, catalytic region, zinc finger, CCHC-type, peptidase aspartic, catalytic n=1 Tax=Tanacetum cinerariifolium TaxID=118510 RepID=A0A6L2JB46_TANCI|nr:hypothetical protein [Tanacetum cinerariifolium]